MHHARSIAPRMRCRAALWGAVLLALAGALLASCLARPARSQLFPETGHLLQGDFLAFWERVGGTHSLGPPLSAPLWLDGRETQFFATARLERSPAGQIISATLEPDWRATLPAPLLQLQAAPQRATMEAPAQAAPLQPLEVTVRVAGYSGPAELQIYDAQLRPAGVWPLQLSDGLAALPVAGRGQLGIHQALLLIDGQLAGATRHLFTLDATTSISTGQPRFDELYPRVRAFMAQDTTSYTLDGVPVHGYRSPDSNLLWLRDHTYQARAFRYFEPDMTSLIDAFRRAQRPDGSFPDYLARPSFGVPAGRMPVEADVEYLFVQAVYEAWQATGDDNWLRQNLDAMREAVFYSLNDPQRWDAKRGLVKRPFTIDTWDFEYGPTTIDPTSGKPAPRHWIDDQTVWGIFHGDNTGLAYALELLAQIEEHLGDPQAAADWRTESAGIMRRLVELSWNGSFFRHHVRDQPLGLPGVDESRQLSLSNAYALNRAVLEPWQARAIVEEYFARFKSRGAAFAEWYSIDPPFPAGMYGLAGRTGERPGEYVNGGIMPLVGGELARGAFGVGAERYAFDILARYHFLISQTGESYLWYYPEGNPGKSGPDTLPTDGWGASAMLGALIEGAAGVTDRAARYRDVVISPRWSYTDDVREARVAVRYAASAGYLAYHWQRDDRALRLDLTGTAERAQLNLLLPEGVSAVGSVTHDGQPVAYELRDVFGSHYVALALPSGAGQVEVRW